MGFGMTAPAISPPDHPRSLEGVVRAGLRSGPTELRPSGVGR